MHAPQTSHETRTYLALLAATPALLGAQQELVQRRHHTNGQDAPR